MRRTIQPTVRVVRATEGRSASRRYGRMRCGATLVEVITVAAILAILGALVAAVLVGAKERGKWAVDVSNLRQCGVAASVYASDYDDKHPLTVRSLIAERRIPLEVCRSPSDPYPEGYMKRWIERKPILLKWILGPLPNCSYLGPGDANWSYETFQRKILDGRNPGWLVNLVRCRPPANRPNGERDLGPYLRLLIDGSIQPRVSGYQSGWIEGSVQDRIVSFAAFFADESFEWFEQR